MKLVIEIPDDLLETQFFCQYFGVWSGKLQETFMNGFQLIDNHENEAYKQGYTDGWKERYGEPDRPHGEWKKDGFFAICSECGHELQHYELVVSRLKFCPNCGADMRKEGDENER